MDFSIHQFCLVNRLSATLAGKKKAGFAPRFLCYVDFGLPPVSIDKNPTIVAMFPMMGYPRRVPMRWFRPRPAMPDIAVAIPTMVTGLPHPTRVRSVAVMLYNRCRRSDMDINLRI
jgi:hypothetical protein